MSWINEIPYEEAQGPLKRLYDRSKGPDNNVDNILTVHSLRPHTLLGHLTLYKNVLHHRSNTLPKWYLETIGVYVSLLNRCDYCVRHHFAGLQRLLSDQTRGERILEALSANDPAQEFSGKELTGLLHSAKLNHEPASIQEKDINELKSNGFSDGEILEINQVTSYFNYANRTVLGLGVNTLGDILGLSPNDNDNPDNWSHT